MKQLILFLLFSSLLFAQYSPDDEQLVRETFLRTLDENTVATYFYSLEPEQTNALLLSLANTRDTTYVKFITELNLDKFGKNIMFTLGYLNTAHTRKFLINQILSNQKPQLLPEAFVALGKIGGEQEYKQIASAYSRLSKMDKTGISLFLANLYLRNIIKPDSLSFSIIKAEISSAKPKRVKEALYLLYRFGGNPEFNDLVVQTCADFSNNPEILQYAIGALRKSGYSKYDKQLIDKLSNHPDWRVRCETAALLPEIKLSESQLFSYFTKMLSDVNPNVSIRMANVLQSSNLISSTAFKKFISEQITNDKFNPELKGELVLLAAQSGANPPIDLLKNYQKSISQKGVYNIIDQIKEPAKKFNIIVDSLKNVDQSDLPYLLESLINLQDNLTEQGDYLNMVYEFLGGDNASAAAMTASSIDTAFAVKHKKNVLELMYKSIIKNYDNDNFSETFLIFASLASKIDSAAYIETLNRLTGTSIPAVKLFAYKELGKEPERVLYPADDFEEIWSNSFKYKKAVIKTNRGEIVIQLEPEYAPLSVGNFVMLASRGFYNGVKFHRVVPNFVIQAGDPEGTGWGGPGYSITSEFSPLTYERGTLGMASSGRDTESSQWFITHSYFPHLDGRYSIFGKVISGMDVVDKIIRNDLIVSITFE